MTRPLIAVSNLTKSFTFPKKNKEYGFLRNLLRPEKITITAVNDISFEVAPGETVAFIGPNGAGKSTTIKMLCGILHSSSGNITVHDLNPAKDRKKLAYHIGTVFGQRSQLLPNLPVTDSLEFFGVMYDLSSNQIQSRIIELTKLFALSEFVTQPVRKLSLGQRMRAEIACSLMHRPQAIFLDEPTIGLDVVAKKSLREHLSKLNHEEGLTIFLTSHDTGDIQSLCKRSLVINHGKIIKDIATEKLSEEFGYQKYVDVYPSEKLENFPELPLGLSYVDQKPFKVTIAVNQQEIKTQAALHHIIELFPVNDLDVYDLELEAVIRRIYEN